MQIIVVGCGKVGAKLAQVMDEEGHDVAIVDNDVENFKLLRSNFSGLTITGVPIDEEVLKHAGIEDADVLAAVTPNDNINIMACQVAKEIFNVPIIIGRIYNPDREFVFHQFGFETICPTNMTVEQIRNMILDKEYSDTYSAGNTVVKFLQKKVDWNDIGKRLGHITKPKDEFIFGVIKNGSFQFADPDIKLSQDDIIVISKKS